MNNIWFTWGQVFNASLQELWWGFIQFVPGLILAIVLFVIGCLLGSLVAKAFEQVFIALKVDKLLNNVGAENFFRKAGVTLNSGYFIGQVVKWFVIIIFLIPSLSLVGLGSIADFLKNDVLAFLPKVIVAAFILIIATVVADGLGKLVLAGTKSMNLRSAHLLATITRYAVWIFAFIVALEQLGIDSAYMQILFTGIIAMLSLGGALAFGLGGKEHASRFLSRVSEEVSNK